MDMPSPTAYQGAMSSSRSPRLLSVSVLLLSAACLKAHGLEAAGPAALAQYDPPWVLGPWRRNEAMVPVD